ncbi:MAG: zinc-binding dehydrogenase [Planctomycetales bacterium]|nr:zinc-binding dehydrogenase [Planctomycetales bacterium]
MRAAVFHGSGKELALEERPLPEPAPGDARVRVVACGVCHTDLHYVDHGVPTAKPPPIVLGHEASGTVDALGEGTLGPPLGSRVLVPAVVSCGRCEACGLGRGNLCPEMQMFGNHRDGAFAEFVLAPARELVPVPADLPLEEAALLADGVTTAYHAVRRRGEVGPGDTVAVFGCGGVGLAAVQVAVAAGARVVAVDLDEARLKIAREMGASEAVPVPRSAGSGATAREVRRLVGGGGADVAIESAGHPSALQEALAAVHPGGRVVLLGYSTEDVPLPAGRIMFREIEIRGSLGCRRADYARVVEMARAGTIRLAPLVTARLPLESAGEALQRLRRREGVRTLLLPGESSARSGARS